MSELSLNKFRCKSVIFQNALFAYLTTVKIELVTNDQSNDILIFFIHLRNCSSLCILRGSDLY